MLVNAEIRDTKKLNKSYGKVLYPLGVWLLLIIGGIFLGINTTNIYLQAIGIICVGICIIVFIPMVIWLLWKANKKYKETWITKSFNFIARDGHIYLNDKKLHVNYNKKANSIYIHDMGDYEKPYDATFYATVKEPDISDFLRYIEDNDIEIEEEYLPILPGEYGSVAPLGMSQYRR